MKGSEALQILYFRYCDFLISIWIRVAYITISIFIPSFIHTMFAGILWIFDYQFLFHIIHHLYSFDLFIFQRRSLLSMNVTVPVFLIQHFRPIEPDVGVAARHSLVFFIDLPRKRNKFNTEAYIYVTISWSLIIGQSERLENFDLFKQWVELNFNFCVVFLSHFLVSLPSYNLVKTSGEIRICIDVDLIISFRFSDLLMTSRRARLQTTHWCFYAYIHIDESVIQPNDDLLCNRRRQSSNIHSFYNAMWYNIKLLPSIRYILPFVFTLCMYIETPNVRIVVRLWDTPLMCTLCRYKWCRIMALEIDGTRCRRRYRKCEENIIKTKPKRLASRIVTHLP